MKFSCDRRAIAEAFQLVATVAPQRSLKPILTRAKLSVTKDSVSVEGTAFQDNFRAALLFDGTDTSAGVELKGVSISGVSIDGGVGQYGLVTQNGIEPAGLREGLDSNAFQGADADFSGTLAVVKDQSKLSDLDISF